MSTDDFRDRCIGLGYLTVRQQARALGVSTRAVDRYRAGEPIPPHVIRNLDLREQVHALKAEVVKWKRAAGVEVKLRRPGEPLPEAPE